MPAAAGKSKSEVRAEMAYVELQELRRVFHNEVVALDGITLGLEAGEFVSLLGPSGCGKTTALRIVAGFDRPTSGHVVVEGKDVSHVPPNRRNMGMVFQAYSLFPNLTAEKNVEFGLRIRGQDRDGRRRRVAELLELVGLAHAGKRYPHQLSGGMQQRIALARALAIAPRVLLLDEPLSALDAKVRVQLREEIRRIQLDLGITTIYVTHDQEEALSISDRVAVLYRGRIEQIGTPAEMYGAPDTPFVAEFIGTMNRLQSTVEEPGWIAHGGTRLRVDAARGRERGERVLLLVRPETIELTPANGDAPVENALAGTVLTHTFLGASTRIKVDADGSEITADMPTGRIGDVPIGTRVHARFAAGSARLLTLGDDADEIVAAAAAAAAAEA